MSDNEDGHASSRRASSRRTSARSASSRSASSHFGKQVRKARMARNWTLRDLSRESGIDPGYLSRVETGKRAPSEAVAAALDDAFPERDGWFSDWARESRNWSEIPPAFRNFSEIEVKATTLRVWAPGIVHGLAQTPGYARAMLATYPGATSEVIDKRLQARMERQQCVLWREDPPETHIIVDEAALYRRIGSPQIMADQMTRLLELADLDHVRLQVMPAIEHPVSESELIIADNAAFVESLVGGGTHTNPDTVALLSRLFSTLAVECYRSSESRELLRRMRDTWIRLGESQPTQAQVAGPASRPLTPTA
jgi:transcriptional regulator with XRE-family HTH domain